MEVKFNCTFCRRKISAGREYAGMLVDCPSCGCKLDVPSPAFNTGDRLGKYIIDQCLGAGAMGEVYLAQEDGGFAEVALKVISLKGVDQEDLERFQKEVKLQASIHHPNIVPAYKAGEVDGYHFLAMAYIEGESLADRQSRVGRMDEQEVLEIGQTISKALHYAWEEVNLLHRDIKPANIMLDKNGHVMLADLGIAKSSNLDPGLTTVGFALGTPDYMSPEQARVETVDCRTDIYALGATLFHLLAGEPPHDANSVAEVLANKFNLPAPDVREFNPAISANTARLLQRMLSRSREKRAEDWLAQEGEFKRVLVGKPPEAPAPVPVAIKTVDKPAEEPAQVTFHRSPRKFRRADRKVGMAKGGCAGTGVGIVVFLAILALIAGAFVMNRSTPAVVPQDTVVEAPPPLPPPEPVLLPAETAPTVPEEPAALADAQRSLASQLIESGDFKVADRLIKELAAKGNTVASLTKQYDAAVRLAQERALKRRLAGKLGGVADAIVGGEMRKAEAAAEALVAESAEFAAVPEFSAARPRLELLTDDAISKVLLHQLSGTIGQTLMLQTKDGPEVIHVTAVDPRGIRGRKRTPTSYTFLRIALSALTDEEVVERVRPSKPHGRYLAAVAMAARRMPHAQAAMASFDDPLSALIATRLPKSGDSEATRSKKQPAPENGAKAEFSRLLHGLGLPPKSGAAEWFKLLFAKRDDADYLATVRAATQLYLRQYGAKLTAQQRTLVNFMATIETEFWPPSRPATALRTPQLETHRLWALENVETGAKGTWRFENGRAHFRESEALRSFYKACKAQSEFTVEVMFRTSSIFQTGPARIVSASNGPHHRNFSLVQDGRSLQIRVRTSENGRNGDKIQPKLFLLRNNALTHVIVTYQDGELCAYENGALKSTVRTIRGSLSDWQDFEFLLGNEVDVDRPWEGAIYLHAVYPRALNEGEAQLHFTTAKQIINGR